MLCLLPYHQRLHQYVGDHKETWGGVTINIDSSVVDGPVLGATGTAPTPTVPLPTADPVGVPLGTWLETEWKAGSVGALAGSA